MLPIRRSTTRAFQMTYSRILRKKTGLQVCSIKLASQETPSLMAKLLSHVDLS